MPPAAGWAQLPELTDLDLSSTVLPANGIEEPLRGCPRLTTLFVNAVNCAAVEGGMPAVVDQIAASPCGTARPLDLCVSHLPADIRAGDLARLALGCARLRVGEEESGWAEGRVLFFDDSWEHEVHNRCEDRRAVFQVVFLHPQLWEAAGGDWRAAAGFEVGRG